MISKFCGAFTIFIYLFILNVNNVDENEILNDDITDDVQTQESKLNISMEKNSTSIMDQIELNNKYVTKYKKYIEDIPKHVCYCCQRLYFAHQICCASHSYITQFFNPLKI